MRKVNISEEKLKKVLREVFKEEVLNNDGHESNPDPFGLDALADKNEMEHEEAIDYPNDTKDKNYYPGFNEMI